MALQEIVLKKARKKEFQNHNPLRKHIYALFECFLGISALNRSNRQGLHWFQRSALPRAIFFLIPWNTRVKSAVPLKNKSCPRFDSMPVGLIVDSGLGSKSSFVNGRFVEGSVESFWDRADCFA